MRNTSAVEKYQVSFKATKKEFILIGMAVTRAKLAKLSGDGISTQMDLVATHANGCKLDFKKLLAFDDFSFAHDIYGIARHLDRETGELRNCFVPRCSAA